MPVFVKRSHFWIASSRRAVLANSGVRSPPPSRPLHSNSCAGNHRPREIGHGLALLFRSCHFDEALKKNSSTSQCSRFSSASGADSLTVQEYNFLADRALLELQDMLEVALEDSGDDDVDVDYSQGVLNVGLGKRGHWVLNKQAPNKEIWWSSPLSGPMRFRPQGVKSATSRGWVDVRGSGTTLHDLFTKEIGTALNTAFN